MRGSSLVSLRIYLRPSHAPSARRVRRVVRRSLGGRQLGTSHLSVHLVESRLLIAPPPAAVAPAVGEGVLPEDGRLYVRGKSIQYNV